LLAERAGAFLGAAAFLLGAAAREAFLGAALGFAASARRRFAAVLLLPDIKSPPFLLLNSM